MQVVAPDASLILGRDYAEGGVESPPSHFFAVCPNAECSRISRRLVRIETRSDAITVANLAKKDTQRVLLDGVVVKFDAPVTIKETAPLRLGDDIACQDGGDVRAYVVTPTDDKFLLPVDDDDEEWEQAPEEGDSEDADFVPEAPPDPAPPAAIRAAYARTGVLDAVGGAAANGGRAGVVARGDLSQKGPPAPRNGGTDRPTRTAVG